MRGSSARRRAGPCVTSTSRDGCVTGLALRELAAEPGGLLARFGPLRSGAYPWLLDSALEDGRLGRFSFAGCDPYAVLRITGRAYTLDVRRPVRPDLAALSVCGEADPFELIRRILPRPPASPAPQDAPPFVGGAVGYLGHELAAETEAMRFHGADTLGLPDVALLLVDRVLAFDHARRRLVAVGLGFANDAVAASARAEAAALALAERVAAGGGACGGMRGSGRRGRAPARVLGASSADAAEHAKHVETAKERIAAGDVYQVCLTHRLEAPFEGDSWELYTRLRAVNPAPFAAWLELPELSLVGSSPERFLRVDAGRRVETRPMKGTRPRGRTAALDARLRADLVASGKDRAENVMIVDLARNDLGRVCETGSVAVPELCAIESYASVHQLVSTVTGTLRSDRDAVDLLRAAFPPGSMTGAPKRAALRILDGLEPVRRGPYSGALGYLDARGGADLCVVIRTLLLRNDRAYLQVGGGVVADSEPAAEWLEALDKARALLDALGGAGGDAPV